MKKYLVFSSLLIFALLFWTGCKKTEDEVLKDSEASVEKTKESSEDRLIRPGIGIGDIQFGMTVQQMKDILGKPDSETDVSYLYYSLGIEIVFSDNVVTYIHCGNPHRNKSPVIQAMEEACMFKTAEGIGIGSTKAQVVEALGQPTSRKDNQLRYMDKRIIFFCADDKVIGIWLRK
jgi:outer membrane protein assembly factor BamE (lipoprotein component of BamABCDE complex)